MKHLPNDVVAEILYHLPYKYVTRLSLVSKNWFGIITDPRFSSMHAAKNKPFATFYCMWGTKPPYNSYMLDVYNNCDYVRTDFKQKVGCVVGSCNGLICSITAESETGFDRVSILNPITDERVTLPIHYHDEDETFSCSYGFCYSPSTNRYKVLKYVWMWRPNRDLHERCCYVFTIGVDLDWRELSPCPLFPNYRDCFTTMVPFNGALHCISERTILAFDVDEETTRRIQLPQSVSSSVRLSYRLIVLHNRLCLFKFSKQSGVRVATVWEMEDYGVEDSWARVDVGQDSSLCGHERCNNRDRCATILGFADTRVSYGRGSLFEFTPTFSTICEVLVNFL